MPTSHYSDIDNAKIAGNYDLDKTIGKGHFAVVKLARHVFTGEMVAVKIIDKTKLDLVSREHLFQEVICMKLVQHPHVVRLYEVIDTVHKLYLIQEWGDGGDLYDYIMKHENGLPESQAKHYFAQILNAIAYCHKLHVVHRDLKPENVVFFKKEGVVKLTDFGFSNKFTPGTHLETSCGSLAYSAPEILLGDSYDPPKVDIWSLGVILYMLVCGRLPFQEANDSETLTKIMDCHYTFPSQLGSSCENLIRLMLCRDPTKRATLDEILAHPWFHGSQIDRDIDVTPVLPDETALTQVHLHSVPSKCCQLPLVCQHKFSYEEHMELLNLMADGNVATQAEIQASLDEDRYDYLTSTYFLLAERKLRRRHLVSIASPEVSSSCISAPLPVPPDQSSNSSIQQSVVQANVPVRVLTPESDSSIAPEDRLRRFSMILEDQEEEEDDLEEDYVYNEEMDESDIGKRTSGIIFEDEDEEEKSFITNNFGDMPHTIPLRKMSSTSEAQHSSSYRDRVLMIQQKIASPLSYELGEFIEVNSEGVATLRFFKASAWGLTSRFSNTMMSSRASSASRRPRSKISTLSQVHSMPHLLQGILLETIQSPTGPSFQKSCSTIGDSSSKRPVSFDITNWQRGASVSLRGTVESTCGSSSHSGFSKYHWRARIKRRSLPPLGTVSPSGYRRQKKTLNYRCGSEASAGISKSHSNSSESSDAENTSRLQSQLAERSILECIEVSNIGAHSAHGPSPSNPYNQVSNFFNSQTAAGHGAVARTARSAVTGLSSNQSGSSSGINLRDNYAPIHEDVETESVSSQTHVGRFHHSFSMTPTPNPSGWNVVAPYVSQMTQPINRIDETPSHQLEYGRRRSDYGHVNTRPGSGADTPARHSVHGLSSHRCFVPLPPNGVPKSKHSGRSMSQSNFSLSSLANSLRASKMMMEVIRGTYELQMYQQRSKAASSINSSTQHIHQGEGNKASLDKEESTNHRGMSHDPISRDKVNCDPRPSSDSMHRTTPEGDVVTDVITSPRFGLYPEKLGHINMNNGKIGCSSAGRMHGNGLGNNVANSMPAFPVYSYDQDNRTRSINDGDNNTAIAGATDERRENTSKTQHVESNSFNTPCRRIRPRRACCILS